MLRNPKVLKSSFKKMYLELKLFLNLSDNEIAEVLENIEGLQHIETFRELKEEIIKKYESKKALQELNFLDADLTETDEPF
tara:strand:- start:390 stop:632 length:243 start_codon:yes stop_codon:yes gene_type:complete